jgi:two-component system sensor histidine kinase HydH
VVWPIGASSAAFLALALLAVVRRARHPLAIQLGLMSVGLFAYNLAELLSIVEGRSFWAYLGDMAAALTAIPTFELFVGFLGASGRFRALRRVLGVYFAALGIVGLAPLALPDLLRFREAGGFAAAMLVGLVPAFLLILVLVVRNAGREEGAERVRIQMLGGALLVGVGSVLTDLASISGLSVPRLSHFGLLVSSLLVAALVLEARIIEGVRVGTVVNVVFVAILAIVAQVVLVAWAGDRTALVFFGTTIVVLLSAAALLPLLRALSEQRARTEQLITLGRFAQQMAHDIRNPLAAIKGAAQFLETERKEGRSLDGHEEMLAIIVERTDRIERFIADYQRMGRVEPALCDVEPSRVAAAALRAVEGLASDRVEVVKVFHDNGTVILADPDLLVFALENLVRNACEAMPDGGTLTVRTELVTRSTPKLLITVEDTGAGMDVRSLDRAMAGLFTTKAGGTGLGLAFVKRVVHAHGGRFSIASQAGRGTTATIELPADQPGTPDRKPC